MEGHIVFSFLLASHMLLYCNKKVRHWNQIEEQNVLCFRKK